jgi:hypothetical protein
VNWRHIQAFVWLRWRLLNNHWRRGGSLNAALMMVLTFGVLVTAVPLFIACFLLGLFAIPRAAPVHLMFAWDALIASFLLFWGIGLLTELQRSEPVSLSKFLHLPVSVGGAFLLNYLGSLVRLSLLLFAPMMLGFSLALIHVKGLLLVPVLPLLAAFVLMVTALTYQLQGWLASLMNNPRRRRTVVVAMTAAFVLVFQLPNLLNFYAPWSPQRQADQSAILVEELAKLDRGFQSHKFDAIEHLRRQREVMKKHELATQQAYRESVERWERSARLVNLVLPVGWLPLGVMSAAEGHVMPSILGLSGMMLIGTASLWRAYRTTIRLYQGESTNPKGRRVPAAAAPSSPSKRGSLLLEARLPGLSEPVSAITLGGFRALLRAPEAKMMLLTPLIMVPIFGSMILRGSHDLPELIRPLIAIAAMVLVLFGVLQLMGNQFGFDRDGFRVFVLCAANRRDILLGKNLAFAPVVLGMAAILLPIVQLVYRMRMDHLMAMFPQYISMFLLFCVLANSLSIYAPMHVAAGAMKSSNPKLTTVLLQMVMFTILFPLTQGLTLLPLGVEALLELLGWTDGAPIYLLLSLAECAAVVLLYRLSLDWLGGLLQARERSILESVTNRGS